MSDNPKTRRRRTESKRVTKAEDAADNASASVSADSKDDLAALRMYTQIIWIPLVAMLGALIYLNPAMVSQVVNFWIGIEEPVYLSSSLLITADVEKRGAVVEAFKHAWRAYERDAMGDDEYHAMSRKGSNLTEAGGIGYTVIDSIDTMLIMGLEEDYSRARDWVEKKLTFERDAPFNTFETTIRVLGGLLSAYHLSGEDQLYLIRAIDLGDRLLAAFETPSGLPLSQINLAARKGVPDKDFPNLVSTAEAATLQLELRYLTLLTDNDVYWEKAENVMRIIKRGRMPHGLASIFMSVDTGKFVPSAIRLGSRGDSYYEYLLKQYIQTNYTEEVYREMYDDTMQAIHQYLIQTSKNGLVYTAELIPETHSDGQLSWRLTPKQDHLVCFFGGSLMLGATITGTTVEHVSVPPQAVELSPIGSRDWKSGEELIKTCMATHDTATGLAPEIVYFRVPNDGMDGFSWIPEDWYIKGAQPGVFPPYDARYILRPETVESLFIAYRLTGHPKYREYGWKIFQSIETYCRVETGGYASIINVDEVPVRQEDKMETFLMSETLKYLYLLFDDGDVLPLNKYVFNTEAHPLPIFTPTVPASF